MTVRYKACEGRVIEAILWDERVLCTMGDSSVSRRLLGWIQVPVDDGDNQRIMAIKNKVRK